MARLTTDVFVEAADSAVAKFYSVDVHGVPLPRPYGYLCICGVTLYFHREELGALDSLILHAKQLRGLIEDAQPAEVTA